jgi:hypothetical protein
LATKACELTDYKEAHILSTLASTYAELGDFETAIKWSEKSVELGEGDMKEQLRERARKLSREKNRGVKNKRPKRRSSFPKGNLLET